MCSSSEDVAELLRQTADKIESDTATLSKASYQKAMGMEGTHRLDIEWWEA